MGRRARRAYGGVGVMSTEPGTPRRFIHLFGGPRESSDLVNIARGACREGFAVIPIEPGGKVAICTLTERQAAAADRMAANTAREAGRRRWEMARHACGLSHAITDPKEAERVFKRLVTKHPMLNLALECSLSRLICVDADNRDEVRSFTELWAREENLPELANAAPTVRSPGAVDVEGTWVHKDGGHYWFLLPDGVDFIDTSISTSLPIGLHEAKAQVRFGRAYALVPPSVRDEGAYTMASDIGPCPGWLVDILRDHVEGVTEKRMSHHRVARDGTDPIHVWSSLVSWEELLGQDGWTTRNRPDTCGCPVWSRPGEWTNPKSATAHEAGCARWDTELGFLHLWTDNPPDFIAAYRRATGKSSMSKLQYVAWRDFGGDTSAAMHALGIQSGSAEPEMTDDEIFAAAREAMAAQGKERGSGDSEPLPPPDPDTGDESTDDKETDNPEESWWQSQVSGYPAAVQGLIRSEFTRTLAREGAQAIREALRAREAEAGRGQRVDEFEISAAELAVMPHIEPEWVVEGLLEVGQLALLAAPAKAGKTTLAGNLLRSLSYGEPFLGQFPVPKIAGSIYVMDIEMTRSQHIRWVQEMGIDSGEIRFQHLRGRVADFNIVDDTCRSWWARRLHARGVSFLIVDPLAPVLQAAGLDEDSTTDTVRWFAALKELCYEAGISNSVVCHHHGHTGERARGSSNLLATPDALWTMVKSASGQRYFSAIGRDVDVAESALDFDLGTRKLSIPDVGEARPAGVNTRPDPGNDQGKQDMVMAAIRGHQGLSTNELKAAVKIKGSDVPKVVDVLKILNLVVQVPRKQTFMHFTSDYESAGDAD